MKTFHEFLSDLLDAIDDPTEHWSARRIEEMNLVLDGIHYAQEFQS